MTGSDPDPQGGLGKPLAVQRRSPAVVSSLAPHRVVWRVLVIGALLASAAAAWVIGHWVGGTPDVEQQRVYLETLTLIVGGFVVAGLGALIPGLITAAKEDRETALQSRRAYSEAKTSVIYLPGSLAEVGYAEAMCVLERAHRKLHIAETYHELDSYLDWYSGGRDVWVAENYWQLAAARLLLQSFADTWKDADSLSKANLVEHRLGEVKRAFFDPLGTGWQSTLEGIGYKSGGRSPKIWRRRGRKHVPRICWNQAEECIEKWLWHLAKSDNGRDLKEAYQEHDPVPEDWVRAQCRKQGG